MDKKNELEKTYNPAEVEDRIYDSWIENKYFHAETDSKKKPYTIVIPPPNVTGQLHMGHALDETLQDILIRYKRMSGYSALWIPGTDHAGIATQIKVEEALRKEEGLTRYDLGREKFLERVWDWKNKFGSRIINQLKKLGSSCDWDRERFTMDEGCSKAVKEVFVDYYNKGLIYQGSRIINWCPHCITALSDAEVEYAEQDSYFWHINYPVKDSDEVIEIATTRPETLFGDTAVAVHPDDERYKHLVGKTLVLPLVGREIPIIADEYVDMEFGTGCVKITPAHDPNDFEVGLRHNLEQIKVLNDDATLNANCGKFEGLDRYEGRKQAVDALKEQGFLVKVVPHKHNVGQCYRCGTTVEPIISKQWFVKMKPLAQPAIDAVKNKETEFVPEHFEKIYFHWLENIRDWCISRQLWWGHRIPAFYCDDCGEVVVTKEDKAVCPKCGKQMRQDPDTLDTWFSSALWPFSTLGWPDKTDDFNYFYPTSTLVTGYDIIPFWVMRMMFSGIEHTGKAPFKKVLIHGLVRDDQGRKMSKSLGNGIDPLEVIKEYGADALRFTLATGNAPGNDMRFYMERVVSSRNFANKIWNASRFLLMNLDIEKTELPCEADLKLEDKWIISKYNTLVKEVTENIDKFELGIAVSKLYDFIWDSYCDWYIELVKPRLYDNKGEDKKNVQNVLAHVLIGSLKLLHPFMPFITEEIFSKLPTDEKSIMISSWPVYDSALCFDDAEKQMQLIMESIRSVRNIRSQMNVVPSRKAKLIIVAENKAIFEGADSYFEKLASASETIVESSKDNVPENAVNVVVPGATIYIPLDELVDKDKEIERLTKELKNLEGEIKRVEGKLKNAGFVAKAPEKVVEEEKEKGRKYAKMLEEVKQSLEKLK